MPPQEKAPIRAASRPTLRELEVFRTVVLSGKTTAAAHQLRISQPAVSRALLQLERRRGKALFRREGNRLVPTADALALHHELEPMFQVLERLDARSERTVAASPLRIVAPASLAHRFLVSHIAAFLRENEACRIVLEVTPSPNVIADVADGAADVGLTNGAIAHAGVRSEALLRSRAACVMPARHPLAKRRVIAPQHLRGERFIALTRRFSSRSTIDRIFDDARVERTIVVEASTTVSAVELVKRGAGITIVNPFPVYGTTGNEVAFRLFEPPIVYSTNFVLPTTAPRADARRFVDFVRTHRSDIAASPFIVQSA